MVVKAVAFQFLVAERQCGLARCAQENRRIVFVGDDFGENAADLQAGRILTGRNVPAFDGFVDAFEPPDFKCHRICEFFEHTSQMLKIAADKKLRLASCDVERRIHRVDGVGDLLHLGPET